MMFFTRKKEWRLACGTLRERADAVPGPGRGWYRIYSYVLGEDWEAMLPPVRYEGETLALVMIDIGAYREREIDGDGLAAIRRILDAFAGAGMDMLLRVVYDTQGKGMEREPGLFSQVLAHIGQIGELLSEYEAHILLFQGLLVGSWGEMHTSKFLTQKHLRQMEACFREASRGKILLAFRTPALLRKIVKEGEKMPETIGFFDDAILADETHMGTFGTQPRAEAGWERAWSAGEETAFLAQAARRVPFGGEVLNGMENLSAEEILARLSQLSVSYLNCTHDAACLARWREMSAAPGVSLYDYVGAHLGYRFVAEEAELERKGKEYILRLVIANRGFACFPAVLRLVLRAGDQVAAETELAPEALAGGGSRRVDLPLSEELLEAQKPLSLCLTAGKGGRVVPFANEGAGKRLSLGAPVRGIDGQ